MKTYFEHNPYSATKINDCTWHIHDATIDNPVGLHEDGNYNNPSSIFVIEDTTQVLVIDLGNPYKGNSLREMVDEIANGKKIKVAITHNHFDHIGALSQFNDCEIYYSNDDPMDNVNHPHIVKGHDQIKLDTLTFDVIEVPGHTKGSLAFLEKEKGIIATGDAFGSSYVWLLFMEDVISIYQKTLEKVIPILKEVPHLTFLCGHRYQQQFQKVKGIHPLSPRNPDMGILYLEDMYELTKQIQSGIAVNHEFEAFGRKDLKAYTYGRAEIDTYIPGHLPITI